MLAPGIDAYFPHYQKLFESSQILKSLIIQFDNEKNKNTGSGIRIEENLVFPFIITHYCFLECFLSELEYVIDKSSLEPPYNKKRKPPMAQKPFALLDFLSNDLSYKDTDIVNDFQYIVKIRNRITHASGEAVNWTSMNVMPVGESFEINEFSIRDKDWEKLNLADKVIRDKRADEFIEFLAKKELVYPEYKGRMSGWMNFISTTRVARWFYFTIMEVAELIIKASEESEVRELKSFASFARKVKAE